VFYLIFILKLFSVYVRQKKFFQAAGNCVELFKQQCQTCRDATIYPVMYLHQQLSTLNNHARHYK